MKSYRTYIIKVIKSRSKKCSRHVNKMYTFIGKQY